MTAVAVKRVKDTKRLKMNYTGTKLMKALNSIKEGKYKICEAARIFKIPRQTLADKLRGRRPEGYCRPGPSAVLGTDVELKIEEWLLKNDKHGFLMSKEGLHYSIKHILNSIPENLRTSIPFKNDTPGKGWFKCFRERHPKIAQIYAASMIKRKFIPTDAEIRDWFEKIQCLLKETNSVDVLRKPGRIFVMNEILLGINFENKVCLVEKKRSNSLNDHYAVFLAANALGELAPPIIVAPDIEALNLLTKNMKKDWTFGISETCSMTCDLFYEYITDVFNPYLSKSKIELPVVVFLDGDFTCNSLPLTSFCEENKIILLGLPRNVSKILHPLNASLGHFPLEYMKENETKISENENKNKHPILCSLEYLFSNTLLKQYVTEKFASCELFPMRRKANYSYSCKTTEAEHGEILNVDLDTIEYIESKIPGDLLEQFKNCKDNYKLWNGSIEYEALYDFWLNSIDAVKVKKERIDLLEFGDDADLDSFIVVEEIIDISL